MKYIDADKLKAEIKERLHCNGSFDECFDTAWDHDQGMVDAYNYVLSFIDTLQQEQSEVDLEEEVKKYFEGYWPGMKTPEACNHQMVLTPPAIMRMIEHFYELGLNTRKEEH